MSVRKRPTKIFMYIERITEGERNARIKLDKAGGFNKVWRRVAKHAGWLAVAFLTGFTFVGYLRRSAPYCRTSCTATWADGAMCSSPSLPIFTYMNARLAARTGLLLHVPVRSLPERHVRSRHLIISYDAETRRPPRFP